MAVNGGRVELQLSVPATARSFSATDRGTRTGAACCRTHASISPITNGAA